MLAKYLSWLAYKKERIFFGIAVVDVPIHDQMTLLSSLWQGHGRAVKQAAHLMSGMWTERMHPSHLHSDLNSSTKSYLSRCPPSPNSAKVEINH